MPPPYHGASMVGQRLKESKLFQDNYENEYINISLAKSIQDVGTGSFRKLYIYIRLLLKVVYKAITFKPDLCYVTPNASGPAFIKDFLMIEIIKLLGTQVIVHYHNKGVAQYQRKFLYNVFYHIFFKNLKVILLSELLYNDIKKYVKHEDVYISKVGIPIEIGLRSRKDSKVQFVFISNLIPSKGIYELIEACELLNKKRLDFKCILAGGESRKITKIIINNEIVKRNLSDNVEYKGRLSEEEKNSLLANSDVFVFPTYYHNECFPAAILEAMKNGLAVISTYEGAIPDEVITGKTGLLVKQRSTSELAHAMEFLILNKDMLCYFKTNAPIYFSENFTIDIFNDTMNNIFKNVIYNND